MADSDMFGVRRWTWPSAWLGSIAVMADAASLHERLEQIGTQLDWVRDYL
jgi:ClpP class serine protease